MADTGKIILDPLVPRARALRREQTDAERLLWGQLRNRRLGGHKFRRQTPRVPFIVDFVCLEKKLVIELDGGQHGEDAALAYDARRTALLNAEGLRVLRFWNVDVLKNLNGVLSEILRALRISHWRADARRPSPVRAARGRPLPCGERGFGYSERSTRAT